jgi:hypothetical protein
LASPATACHCCQAADPPCLSYITQGPHKEDAGRAFSNDVGDPDIKIQHDTKMPFEMMITEASI